MLYTRGDYLALPADDADLEVTYTIPEIDKLSLNDGIEVCQTATQEYMIHQFKDFVDGNVTCQLNWNGQSTLAPSASTVYLQIYNHTTTTWFTADFDDTTAADTDFDLIANIADLTDYKDGSNIISCRVYQLAL